MELVEHLGVDETGSKKGYQYITVFIDVERKKVVDIAEGKDIQAFNNALINTEIRVADIDQVAVITLNMPPSFSISYGFSERVNLKIQEIKRITKGYANINNLILMIYFHLG